MKKNFESLLEWICDYLVLNDTWWRWWRKERMIKHNLSFFSWFAFHILRDHFIRHLLVITEHEVNKSIINLREISLELFIDKYFVCLFPSDSKNSELNNSFSSFKIINHHFHFHFINPILPKIQIQVPIPSPPSKYSFSSLSFHFISSHSLFLPSFIIHTRPHYPLRPHGFFSLRINPRGASALRIPPRIPPRSPSPSLSPNAEPPSPGTHASPEHEDIDTLCDRKCAWIFKVFV